MIDRTFFAVLTFCTLIGATVALGSALWGDLRRVDLPAGVQVVQLAPVVVIGKRSLPVAALASTEPAARRVQ